MTKINQEEYEILKGLDDKWKWIARDENVGVWVYKSKPNKTELVWQANMFMGLNNNIFQFIKWEDDEPYNIQGLINEYLDDEYGYFNMKLSREFEEFIKKESEEAEMTKSIEWLKNEVNELPLRFLGFSMSKQREEFTVDKTDVLELINQLDEPKVLSQEWIDNNSVYASSDGITEECVHVDDLKESLVPKQKEVKRAQIPEWIIEWYKGANNEFSTLEDVFDNLSHDTSYNIMDSEKFRSRIMEYGGFSRMYEALSHIYFGAYEIEEEEQKYVVEFPNITGSDERYLVQGEDGDLWVDGDLDYLQRFDIPKHIFTEEEIKSFDKDYWAFAKPVEELEE